LTDQIKDQEIKLPLVKLFEIADLHNQALEKLQIELEKLAKPLRHESGSFAAR
jgi:hypothetical protein